MLTRYLETDKTRPSGGSSRDSHGQPQGLALCVSDDPDEECILDLQTERSHANSSLV